jgi:protein SCO1
MFKNLLTKPWHCLLVATLSFGLSGCDVSTWNPMVAKNVHRFHSVDISGANYAQDFKLPDTQGKMRQLSDFNGQVLFVFFGFTQCPDVCPVTMAELADVREKLGPQADKLQAIFITLDPERDHAQMLQSYVQGMDSSFIALRGTLEETTALAKAFKVYFAKVPSPSGDGYTIDHTAGAYVFDKQGHVRLFARYGLPNEQLLADIKALIDEPAK